MHSQASKRVPHLLAGTVAANTGSTSANGHPPNAEPACAQLDAAIMRWLQAPEFAQQAVDNSNIRTALLGAISGSFLLLDTTAFSPELIKVMPESVWQALGKLAQASGCSISSVCFPDGMQIFPKHCLKVGRIEYIELFGFRGRHISLLSLQTGNHPLHLALKGTQVAVTVAAPEHIWLLPTNHENALTIRFYDESLVLSSVIDVRPHNNQALHGVYTVKDDILELPSCNDALIKTRTDRLDRAVNRWLGKTTPVATLLRIRQALQNCSTGWVLSLDDSELLPSQLAVMPEPVWVALRNLALAHGCEIRHICFPVRMKTLPEGTGLLGPIVCIELPDYHGTEIDLRALQISNQVLHLSLAGIKHRLKIHASANMQITTSGNSVPAIVVSYEASGALLRTQHMAQDSTDISPLDIVAMIVVQPKWQLEDALALQFALRNDDDRAIKTILLSLLAEADPGCGINMAFIEALHLAGSDGYSALYVAFAQGHEKAVQEFTHFVLASALPSQQKIALLESDSGKRIKLDYRISRDLGFYTAWKNKHHGLVINFFLKVCQADLPHHELTRLLCDYCGGFEDFELFFSLIKTGTIETYPVRLKAGLIAQKFFPAPANAAMLWKSYGLLCQDFLVLHINALVKNWSPIDSADRIFSGVYHQFDYLTDIDTPYSGELMVFRAIVQAGQTQLFRYAYFYSGWSDFFNDCGTGKKKAVDTFLTMLLDSGLSESDQDELIASIGDGVQFFLFCWNGLPGLRQSEKNGDSTKHDYLLSLILRNKQISDEGFLRLMVGTASR